MTAAEAANRPARPASPAANPPAPRSKPRIGGTGRRKSKSSKPVRARAQTRGAAGGGRYSRRKSGRSVKRRPGKRVVPPSSPPAVNREEPANVRTYEEGFRDGVYAGGEELLEAHLSPDALYPNLSLEEVVAAGVGALRSRAVPLLSAAAVFEEAERSLAEGRPYALARLGDGELLTLAQDTVLPAEAVRAEGRFLPYAGVDAPDLQARDELIAAVRLASLVGVPMSRRPYFQPLLFAVWNAFGIRPDSMRMTSSTVNYALYEQGYMARLWEGRKVLAIGNLAAELAAALTERGVRVTGTVSPVRGMKDYARVVDEASRHDFDLALVSAGIAAVPICVHLAGRTGKVAIDFGHLANTIAGIGRPADPRG